MSAPFVEIIFFPLIELPLPGDLGYSRLIVGSSFLSVAVVIIMTEAACGSRANTSLQVIVCHQVEVKAGPQDSSMKRGPQRRDAAFWLARLASL